MGVGGRRHAPAALYPRERPGTHCTGGWVGPRAVLDWCGKSQPRPGFDPRTVQPVASRYTDYTTRLTSVHVVVINRVQIYALFQSSFAKYLRTGFWVITQRAVVKSY